MQIMEIFLTHPEIQISDRQARYNFWLQKVVSKGLAREMLKSYANLHAQARYPSKITEARPHTTPSGLCVVILFVVSLRLDCYLL